MGWNTNLVIARDRTLDRVLPVIPDVYTAGEAEVGLEQAASPQLKPSIAVGQVDNCVVLWDPLGNLADNYNDWLTRLSSVHPAIVMKLSSVVGRYAFYVYDMSDCLRRQWSGSELIEAVGNHAGLDFDDPKMPSWGCDEDYLFGLAEQLGVPKRASFETGRYRVFDFG